MLTNLADMFRWSGSTEIKTDGPTEIKTDGPTEIKTDAIAREKLPWIFELMAAKRHTLGDSTTKNLNADLA